MEKKNKSANNKLIGGGGEGRKNCVERMSEEETSTSPPSFPC